MLLSAVVLALVAAPPQARGNSGAGGIAVVDNVALTTGFGTSATISQPFTVTGGDELVVEVNDRRYTQNNADPATIAWGGVTLTKAVEQLSALSSYRDVAIYYANIGPANYGTNNISMTIGGDVTQAWVTPFTLSGVNPTVAPLIASQDTGGLLPNSVTVSGVAQGAFAAVDFNYSNPGGTQTVVAANGSSSSGTPTIHTDGAQAGSSVGMGYISNLTAGSTVFTASSSLGSGNSNPGKSPFAVAVFTPAPATSAQTWINRGTAVYQQIVNTLGVSGSSLFAEAAALGGGQSGGSNGTAYAWPLSTMLRVENSLATLNPTQYDPVLRSLSDQFYSQYWNAAGGGYRSGTAANSMLYYDDNAHVAVALADAYKITADPVYLTRAEATMAFVLSGSDSAGGGGIYWNPSDHSRKDTATTLQAARAALKIYQLTGQTAYLNDATSLYNWAAAHTQLPDGLFVEGYYLTGSSANTAYGYDLVNMAGFALSDNIEFYKATHNPSYLAEAELIASASLPRYFDAATGRINDEGYWAFELTDGLIDLYQMDHDERWLDATDGGLEWLYVNKQDPNGNYGTYWGRNGPQVGPLSSWDLNDQAPVARAYLYLGEGLGAPEPSTFALLFVALAALVARRLHS
jgi:hypothetical protein